MKNRYIIIFFIFLILFSFEIFGFFYFSKLSNDKKNLELYIEKKKGLLSYNYFKNVNYVFPSPNSSIIYNTKEFTDKFTSKDILGYGFGFFDDGINEEKKIKAVAIGDSFTNSVGSINNLENGWVELLEKKSNKFDIINIGSLGAGIHEQVYAYNQIKKKLPHEIVFYNFNVDTDYIDNLEDNSFNFFIKNFYLKKENKKKIDNLIKDLQLVHGYKYYLEYLLNNNFRLYSIYYVLKTYDFLIAKKLFAGYSPQKKYKINQKDLSMNILDKKYLRLKNKLTQNEKIKCLKKYCVKTNSLFNNKKIMNILSTVSAKYINEFAIELRKEKKEMILIILPNKNSLFEKKYNGNYSNLNELLIKKINKDILIIDLNKHLRNYKNMHPEMTLFYKHNNHPNIHGYKVISEYLYENIKNYKRG